jgi:hypothetical protein
MRPLSSFCLCLLALGLAGCAGYRVGPVNGEKAGQKSVQVVPFGNKTLEPNLTDAVTTELRRRLQQDGTYRLATHGDGDIILSGDIISFSRDELTLNPQDTLTFKDYRINIGATVTVRSRTTGEVVFTHLVTGFTSVRAGADVPSAERQALPLLADNLAKRIVSLLAEGKWW